MVTGLGGRVWGRLQGLQCLRGYIVTMFTNPHHYKVYRVYIIPCERA